MIQDMTPYEDAKNLLTFGLAPDCNQMTLKRELASITPEVREEPAAFLSKNTYAVYPNQQFPVPWAQHIHYNAVPAPYVTTPTDSSCTSSQSSELQLGLPALLSSSTISVTTLDMRAPYQSTSATNMVIPSKEIASAAPIVSPEIVCWNATGHAFQDPCHIHSSICQIDNLMPSTKTFIRKYASTRAFQIPIKLGAVKAHALIDTGAQCSILSSGLVKRAFDKQLLQLPICGKIKVANGPVVNTHGPVVVTMESGFSEHMIKCVILDDDGNDQCIIGTDFLAYPDIHAILNFKENYIKIQDIKLPLKVIASVRSQTELFLNAAKDNFLE
uniref:Peptidase A2 domain-containing protein n=1 Tax=Romanomermis culicivorax TaxID=13658 RepID=A0A915JYB2_ROMCU